MTASADGQTPATLAVLRGLLARATVAALLLAAGPVGWVLEFGDGPAGGRSAVPLEELAAIYIGIGFAIGALDARHWRLAGLAPWLVAGFAAVTAALMRPVFASTAEWVIWSAPHLLHAAVLPIAAALAGGYAGARAASAFICRRCRAGRASRAHPAGRARAGVLQPLDRRQED